MADTCRCPDCGEMLTALSRNADGVPIELQGGCPNPQLGVDICPKLIIKMARKMSPQT